MAVNSYDPTTGRPIFVDTDAPDIKVDPTEAAKYAADVGTRIIRANLAALDAYGYKRKGLKGFALDTGYEYVHNGTAWVTASGFELVSAQVLTATGAVNFDGVFSSRFRNYEVRVNVNQLSSGGQIAFQMRAGGVNATGATDYVAISTTNSTTTITAASVAGSSGPLHKTNAAALYARMSFFDPAVAFRTAVLIDSHGVGSASGGEKGSVSVQHNPAVAYDGFRLLTSGPSMTGTVSVFGMG